MTHRKGGVGRTPTTIHVAGVPVAAGRNVLVVALDPQGHPASFTSSGSVWR
ncbi:ParA family protein [Streptomyces sp. NPDC001380]|uniref:ParA family protein n=1 Tax=Streptomyces sp. NPDC001380 TaxID=3364566 RepID=UPI0036769C9E